MITIKPYPILRSLTSYFIPKKFLFKPGSGGTISSEYCYSVWLRHLYYLIENKLFSSLDEIKKVAEIGPGDSLGIGLSAIYTGAKEYYAFDVIKHANYKRNIEINDQLYLLFKNKQNIPNGKNLKNVFPLLDNFNYPFHILKYDEAFFFEINRKIRDALNGEVQKDIKIEYIVPWNDYSQNLFNVDLIFSQAVMEHIIDIENAYKNMFKWLRSGGVISHQIDFKTHEMTKEWNGHWFINEKFWKFLSRSRKYPLNRLPLSSHLNIIEKVGFKIIFVKKVYKQNSLLNLKTKVTGVNFSDEDLITSGALIQAIKP